MFEILRFYCSEKKLCFIFRLYRSTERLTITLTVTIASLLLLYISNYSTFFPELSAPYVVFYRDM